MRLEKVNMQPDPPLTYLILAVFIGATSYWGLKDGEVSHHILGIFSKNKHPILYWLIVILLFLITSCCTYMFIRVVYQSYST